MSEGGFRSAGAGDFRDEHRQPQAPGPAGARRAEGRDGESPAEDREPEDREPEDREPEDREPEDRSSEESQVVQPVTGGDLRGPSAMEAEAPADEAGEEGVQGDGAANGQPSTVPSGDGAGRPEAAAEDVSLEAVARQRDEYLDALRRLQADFENYKKRVIKQQTEHLERAAEALVVKLLPVLDAVDLALTHAGDSPEGKVIGPVAAALVDALEKEGLERIDPLGQPFDPNQHDAVLHEEGGEEPEVSEVLRAGYRWKGRVLRPAMVKVKG